MAGAYAGRTFGWRGLSVLALAVTFLGTTTGCRDKEKKEDRQPPAEASASGLVKGERARQGGYLVLPSPEPPFINPVLYPAFDLATPLIFNGLLGLDAKLEPVPVLAESWTRPDTKTVQFKLRRGVTWHDKKPFTSADVAFTIDSIRTTKHASTWRPYFTQVERVETPDPHTVRVVYKEPYGPDLASFIVGIVPRHLYEGQDLLTAPANDGPVGTGAYKFVRWDDGKRMILEQNPDHWAGRPNIDRIELVFDIRPSEYADALRAKPARLDFAEIPDPDAWAGAMQTPEFLEQFETGRLDDAILTLIAWNNKRKPYDDRRVRQALAHALDRPRVIEDILKGSPRPVSGPFSPALWGANPNIAPWPFDLARAAALLDEVGLRPQANGRRFALEMIVPSNFRELTMYDQMLAIFRTDLAKIGVALNVTYMPRNEVVQRLILHNFDAVLFQWAHDIPDPDPSALIHSNEGTNYASYSNPEVDRLLAASRSTTDRAKRREAYHALHKLVHEDQPYTFLYAPQSHYAWSRRVRGVNPADVSPLPRWPGITRWWIATP